MHQLNDCVSIKRKAYVVQLVIVRKRAVPLARFAAGLVKSINDKKQDIDRENS